jgi:hypothetical protein
MASPLDSRRAIECDPRSVLGAESKTLHQILEAKMECEAETNAHCGTDHGPSRCQRGLFAHLTGRGLIGVGRRAEQRSRRPVARTSYAK